VLDIPGDEWFTLYILLLNLKDCAMLSVNTFHSFNDINKGLADGLKLITRALQLEATDKAKAEETHKAASQHLKAVVNRPHFSAFTSNALHIYQDEMRELHMPDRFERLHVPAEIDWDKCNAANATGTDCLLEVARNHPNVLEQRLAIEALREELISNCKTVDALSPDDVDALMMVIEMCNEVHNLDSRQMVKVIEKFARKLEAKHAEKAAEKAAAKSA
jgi:hypothetical protein